MTGLFIFILTFTWQHRYQLFLFVNTIFGEFAVLRSIKVNHSLRTRRGRP